MGMAQGGDTGDPRTVDWGRSDAPCCSGGLGTLTCVHQGSSQAPGASTVPGCFLDGETESQEDQGKAEPSFGSTPTAQPLRPPLRTHMHAHTHADPAAPGSRCRI